MPNALVSISRAATISRGRDCVLDHVQKIAKALDLAKSD